ncbi:hypothetical protein CERSUDRAFT_113018 [Gelatoporia subvermispora B]|uniref:Uncharacterized protein n=1 Tax=Ceriporiopsis subvermispora (strain B) TaxID=914234 RepID=M2PRX6_CERS8|nr:hypothetical protein CERSUDRAFT_113018 [Gelatoporia subvermispora B]
MSDAPQRIRGTQRLSLCQPEGPWLTMDICDDHKRLLRLVIFRTLPYPPASKNDARSQRYRRIAYGLELGTVFPEKHLTQDITTVYWLLMSYASL